MGSNPDRKFFVTADTARKLLDACPDAEWRLIFALCRYGGLRCPSEVLGLRWGDIDWERSRFTIRSPKTEHHDGKDRRTLPIFPELLPHLADAFDRAEPGQQHVVTRCRDDGVNLRTQLERIIERAGLKPWPKLYHNLRASRQTELAEQYPIHVVCAWLGNSTAIAAEHYLQVTEDHYAKAAGTPLEGTKERAGERGTESGTVRGGKGLSAGDSKAGDKQERPGFQAVPTVVNPSQINLLPPRGLEPLS